MLNKLNFKNTIFLFLLSISCLFSISVQAKTPEEQAKDIISKSTDINKFIQYYEDKGISIEPKIVVDGVNAVVIPRSENVISDNYIGSRGMSITAKVSSKYRKNASYLRSYKEFGFFLVLNKLGEINYIFFDPKTQDEITNLTKFKNILGISLRGIESESIDFSGFYSVKELSIFDSKVDNIIMPLKNSIEVINTSLSPIRKIINLNSLNNLVVLNIQSSKLKSLSNLTNSINLRRLYFNSNRSGNITEFPNLSSFPNIEHLHFFSEEVEGIKSIDTLSNLKVLFTGQNFNYSGVKFPKSLEYLSTGGKINGSFPSLDNNTNLKELTIVNTNSSDMNLLKLPSSLEKLTLSYNNINKIEGIDGLGNLKEVNLKANNIEKVEGLDRLKSIEYLKLDENKITKVEGLKNLSGVKGISFEHNPIETLDFSEIEHLKNTKVLMWYTPFWKTATKEDKRKLDNLARKGHL